MNSDIITYFERINALSKQEKALLRNGVNANANLSEIKKISTMGLVYKNLPPDVPDDEIPVWFGFACLFCLVEHGADIANVKGFPSHQVDIGENDHSITPRIKMLILNDMRTEVWWRDCKGLILAFKQLGYEVNFPQFLADALVLAKGEDSEREKVMMRWKLNSSG